MRDAMIDLSHWNAHADFAAAKKAGIEAVCLKASQGSGLVDTLYALRARQAREAGLLLAAYAFLCGDDPEAEARLLLDTVRPEPGMRLMVDLERNLPGQRSASAEEAARTVAALEAEFPAAVILYCGRWQGGLPHPVLAARPLILPRYGPPPADRDLPPGWTMAMLLGWQHTDGVRGWRPAPVPGIGRCDRSVVWLGTADLAAWWRSGAALPAPAVAAV